MIGGTQAHMIAAPFDTQKKTLDASNRPLRRFKQMNQVSLFGKKTHQFSDLRP